MKFCTNHKKAKLQIVEKPWGATDWPVLLADTSIVQMGNNPILVLVAFFWARSNLKHLRAVGMFCRVAALGGNTFVDVSHFVPHVRLDGAYRESFPYCAGNCWR